MPSQVLKATCRLLLGWLAASAAHAVTYPLPPSDTDVIGQIKVIYATKDDTLLDIARRHSLGYNEMVQANPGVDRWTPGEGSPIVLPTRYILPDTPREGIVLNIAEMRLYYYPKAEEGGQRVVHTYPVSIGRMDWKTPLGLAKVVAKETDPVWRPPASIKAEHAADGDILPDVVPSGPDNPLGRHAMRLSIPGYLIHGTDKPYGIGMRVTHGCVRMYPEDIERLYGMAGVGTSVRLIDQPVKVGRLNGQLFLEAHAPLEEEEIPVQVTVEQAHRVVIAKTGPTMPGVDQTTVDLAVEQFSGIPVVISGSGSGSNPAAQPASPPPRETASTAPSLRQPPPVQPVGPTPRESTPNPPSVRRSPPVAQPGGPMPPRETVSAPSAVRPPAPDRSYTAYSARPSAPVVSRPPAGPPGAATDEEEQTADVSDYPYQPYAPPASPVYRPAPSAYRPPARAYDQPSSNAPTVRPSASRAIGEPPPLASPNRY